VPIELFQDVHVEVKTLVVPEGGELPPEEELAAIEAAEAEAAAAEAAAVAEAAAAHAEAEAAIAEAIAVQEELEEEEAAEDVEEDVELATASTTDAPFTPDDDSPPAAA
jgi:hypothetical protein